MPSCTDVRCRAVERRHPRRSRLRASLFVTLAAGLTATSVAAQLDSGRAAPKERIVLLSSSGGTSRGSYKGGVDWTIIEFLRRQRIDSSFRD
ncbi:MAG: hypothetical protein M3466_12125, partial [Gemmatimonadota bacterium]|nr:hypothetical protein [Gemmatimonadota bacterium]